MSGGVFFSFTSLPASCFGFPLYLWFCLSDPKLSSVYYTSSTESDSDETRARRDTTNWHVCELRVHKERGLLLHRDDGSIGGRRAIARDAACFDWRRLAAFVFTGGCFFCLLFVHACFPQCLYSQWYGYITSLYFLATADGCDPLPVCSDGIASSIIPRTAASSTLLGGGGGLSQSGSSTMSWLRTSSIPASCPTQHSADIYRSPPTSPWRAGLLHVLRTTHSLHGTLPHTEPLLRSCGRPSFPHQTQSSTPGHSTTAATCLSVRHSLSRRAPGLAAIRREQCPHPVAE